MLLAPAVAVAVPTNALSHILTFLFTNFDFKISNSIVSLLFSDDKARFYLFLSCFFLLRDG